MREKLPILLKRLPRNSPLLSLRTQSFRFQSTSSSFAMPIVQQESLNVANNGPVKTTTASYATSPYYNQGTALTQEARTQLGLRGYSPVGVENLELQKTRALNQLRSKATDLEKYTFMAQLRNTNTRLFYKLVCDDIKEIAPIIYTPTVGEACAEYSNIYPFLGPPGAADGLYVSINDLPYLKDILRNYRKNSDGTIDEPEITVITDGSRILGLGDLGVGGIGIPIGKLQLYSGAAGIDPRKTLPIVLDFGTNTERYLNDPLYLGLKQKRPDEDKFYEAVDDVMKALYEVFPNILVQFEDFSSEHAFGLLEKYQDKVFCFNDDIQGTGSVILAGFMNAVRLAKENAGVDPKDHRIVFFGAGSSAIGVAKQILSYFMREHGLSEEEAKKIFYLVDSKGLVTLDRGDRLAQHKVYFARSDNSQAQFRTLCDVIDYVKPTALIGLSAQHQAFTQEAVGKMAANNKLPIVFPLSNPMTNAECTYQQAMEYTDYKVLFASGTAFPPVTLPSGELKYAGQGNNMYIFPGLGLGAIVAKAARVSDSMVYEAAKGLSRSLLPEEIQNGNLYPELNRIREVSGEVAAAVANQAIQEGLARDPQMLEIATNFKGQEYQDRLLAYVKSHMWDANKDSHFSFSLPSASL
ncbi:malic enzyme [Lichtheimia hyalospora FSU 10163]|nr:malic enzyme [Lichtheimia hyalospora FSU 10163]